MRTRILAAAAGLALVAGFTSLPVRAAGCTEVLSDVGARHGAVTVTTLDRHGVVGYARLDVAFTPALTLEGTTFPAHWSSAPGTPVLRHAPASSGSDTAQASPARIETIGVDIVVDEPPWVTVTLAGHPREPFELHCTAGGVLHGESPDGDYLIMLAQPPAP